MLKEKAATAMRPKGFRKGDEKNGQDYPRICPKVCVTLGRVYISFLVWKVVPVGIVATKTFAYSQWFKTILLLNVQDNFHDKV